MQLLFKQRFFSWFDSYDIYDEVGNVVFSVQGRFAWGHKLEISDHMGNLLGTVREEVLTLLPRFNMYDGAGNHIGTIKKKLTFFKPHFELEYQGWSVDGDILGWNYYVSDSAGTHIMYAQKKVLNWTDTYVIDVPDPANAFLSLMIVLAIDAAKDNNGN